MAFVTGQTLSKDCAITEHHNNIYYVRLLVEKQRNVKTHLRLQGTSKVGLKRKVSSSTTTSS